MNLFYIDLGRPIQMLGLGVNEFIVHRLKETS